MSDDSSDVRIAAVTALGAIGNTEATEPLIDLLKDPDVEVRASSALALRSLADTRAVEPLIETLSKQLTGGDDRAVGSMAGALGELRDPRAIAILDRTVAESGFRSSENALWALKLIGTTEAIEVIRDVALRSHAGTEGTRVDGMVQRTAVRLLRTLDLESE